MGNPDLLLMYRYIIMLLLLYHLLNELNLLDFIIDYFVRFWFFKFLILVGITVGAFFIPDGTFHDGTF